MARTDPPAHGPIGRRRFLRTAAAWALPPLLLNCRQAPAEAQNAASGPLHVADFREAGLNDRQVLERAFQAWIPRGGTLHLERDRVYDLGRQVTGNSNVFVVFGLVDAVLAGNGATFTIHSQVRGHFNILYLAHYRNLRIENLSCIDTGYGGQAPDGGKFIVLDAGDRDSVDLTLDNVAGEGLVSFVHIQGLPNGPRVRGVRIAPNCRATRVFYAVACLDNGDDMSGGFSTFDCARSYFPSGVRNHDLRIVIHHRGAEFGPIAETAMPIKSYGRPTSNLRVDVTFRGLLASLGSCVTLEHQHAPSAGPSVIEDIDLRITIAPGTREPTPIHRLTLRSYLVDNSLESGPTINIWRRIRLSGDLRPGGAPTIFSRVTPAVTGDITVARGTIGAEPRDIAAPGFRVRRET
jgi:hypothetical protein